MSIEPLACAPNVLSPIYCRPPETGTRHEQSTDFRRFPARTPFGDAILVRWSALLMIGESTKIDRRKHEGGISGFPSIRHCESVGN